MKKASLNSIFVLLLIFVLLFSGCSGKKKTVTVTENNWKNLRIGTPLAWSADYCFSENHEVDNLIRYDSITDCVLALNYNFIDAMAVDRLFATYMVTQSDKIKIAEGYSIGKDRIVDLVAKDRPDLLEELNAYIPVFRASEEFKDLEYRSCHYVNNEFVPNTDIPEIKDGKKLVVAIDAADGFYPYTYYDFKTDSPQGVDIEFIKSFAYAYGYTVEWFDAGWEAGEIALYNCQVDIFASGISEYYCSDLDITNSALHTDPYFDLDLVLIVSKDN